MFMVMNMEVYVFTNVDGKRVVRIELSSFDDENSIVDLLKSNFCLKERKLTDKIRHLI